MVSIISSFNIAEYADFELRGWSFKTVFGISILIFCLITFSTAVPERGSVANKVSVF